MSELVQKVKLEAMKTLKSAMASHEDGRWDEAAQLYTAIVAVLPESADAWALCGLLKYQRGYKPEAAKLFKKALSLNKEQPIAKNFFTQIENDVHVDVKGYCSDTIDREYVVEKLFEISNSQDHRSSDDKAKQDEEMGQLDSPIARDNLSKGLKLQEAGRIIEALALISKAAEIEPRSPYLRFRLGNLLGSLERWDEAIKELTTVIADNPLYGAVYNDRATIYFKQGKLEEAYQDIEKAAVLLANSAQVHRNKGYVLVKKRQLAAAAVSYNKALSIDPESAETYNNLGMALEGMGRLDDARIFYGKAIEKDDKLSLAHWNKGLMSLRMGNFKDGWPLFEKRWQTQMAGKERTYIYPFWDGKSDINGKTILIHYEQGLGDVIQFSRYVKLIEAKGATVVLEVQLPLVSLLKNITDKVTVIASMDGLADNYDRKIDLRCPIMSLPALLKTGTDKIPAEIPYIYASPEKVKFWKEKIKKKTERPQVGVAWAGRSSHNNDHNRSIRLDEFSKLFEREIEFHSLHVDYRETDQEKIKCWQNVQDHSNELNDFSDTAGLIANLDLIISVDTSVAHLAGAMGKPVWMLLPSWPDWRWMADRQDTPWYPTMKLYRQRYGDFDSNNAWKTVIDSIASDIEAISKKGANQWIEFGFEPNDKPDFPCKTQPRDNLKIRDPDFAASLKVIINKYQSAKYTEAKQDCEKLLDSFPDNYHVLTLLGNICYELKDYRLAADCIERSLEKNGRQSEALNILGLIKK